MQQVLTTTKIGEGFNPGTMLLDSAEAERRVIKYKALLCEIGKGFGFSEHEVSNLIEEVLEYARYNRVADCMAFRVWASRIMVHKCAYRIGKKVFWQSGSGAEHTNRSASIPDWYSTGNPVSYLKDVPLSFRAVYILHQLIGFTVLETAQILNTTLAQVIERYSKAQAFLGKL